MRVRCVCVRSFSMSGFPTHYGICSNMLWNIGGMLWNMCSKSGRASYISIPRFLNYRLSPVLDQFGLIRFILGPFCVPLHTKSRVSMAILGQLWASFFLLRYFSSKLQISRLQILYGCQQCFSKSPPAFLFILH